MSRPRLFFASGSFQFTDLRANSSGFHEQHTSYVGSEVLSAVVIKSTILWDITSCSPLKVNRRFDGTYHLHFRGRISLLSRWYLTRLIRPWKWRLYIPPKHRLAFNGLHHVIFQKLVLFSTPAVRDHGSTMPANGSRSRSVSTFTQHAHVTETQGSSKTAIRGHHEPLSSTSGPHNVFL
jgi:hypothetical protein